jgi:hypothetical protein
VTKAGFTRSLGAGDLRAAEGEAVVLIVTGTAEAGLARPILA